MLAIGLTFLCIATVWFVHSKNMEAEYVEVPAVITSLREKGIEVTYTYNGQQYSQTIGVRSSLDKTGDETTVFVNPENPQKAVARTSFFCFLFMFMGFVLTLLGSVLQVSVSQLKRKIRYLKYNGERLLCQPLGLSENHSFTFNNRPTLVLTVKADNGKTFSSQPFFGDIPSYLCEKQVPVYVSRENETDYFVDIDSMV